MPYPRGSTTEDTCPLPSNPRTAVRAISSPRITGGLCAVGDHLFTARHGVEGVEEPRGTSIPGDAGLAGGVEGVEDVVGAADDANFSGDEGVAELAGAGGEEEGHAGKWQRARGRVAVLALAKVTCIPIFYEIR